MIAAPIFQLYIRNNMSIQFSNLFATAILIFTSFSLSAQINPISTLTERLNPQTEEWQKVQHTSFSYDADGNATEQISNIWDNANEAWRPGTRTANSFDHQGNLLTADTEVWNKQQEDWVYAQRIEPQYTNGTKTGSAMYIWDSIQADWLSIAAPMQDRITQSSSKTKGFDHTQAITNSYDNMGRVIESIITTTTNGKIRVMRTHYTYTDASKTLAATDVNLGNYPNPVNTWTSIQFELAEDAYVQIDLFDSLGRVISNVSDDSFTAGAQEVTFDASDLPAGMYYYNLVVNGAQVAGNSMFVTGR